MDRREHIDAVAMKNFPNVDKQVRLTVCACVLACVCVCILCQHICTAQYKIYYCLYSSTVTNVSINQEFKTGLPMSGSLRVHEKK